MVYDLLALLTCDLTRIAVSRQEAPGMQPKSGRDERPSDAEGWTLAV